MLHSTKYHPIFVLSIQKMKKIIVILLILAGSPDMMAQQGAAPGNKDLTAVIARLDSITFAAFNNRDLKGFEQYFSKDLEFYHDKGGLTGYQHTIDFLKRLADEKSDLRRDLVKSSLEVYPVPGYGAIQIGSHLFTHTENEKTITGTFRFMNLWQEKDGKWQITRVISYDH